MAKFSDRLLSLIFPNKCFLCGKVLEGERWLCEACEGQLPYTADELCSGCGKRYAECMCGEIADSLSGAAAPLYYTGGTARGIHRFKYDGRRYYGKYLAALMADAVRDTFPMVSFDGAAWVPTHAAKLRERGFCPALLLAREVCARLGLPLLETGLVHTGRGGVQMRQGGREARRENAKRNFSIRRDTNLCGKTVLLVDDVLTTGETAKRCARLLLKKGAAEVYAVCAATTREDEDG